MVCLARSSMRTALSTSTLKAFRRVRAPAVQEIGADIRVGRRRRADEHGVEFTIFRHGHMRVVGAALESLGHSLCGSRRASATATTQASLHNSNACT